jgi:lipopolysaccharide biosynthesis glycosyltransferase
MIAVTIAFGDAYIRLAELAAASVRSMTGLETHVLQDAHGAAVPVYVKLRLLELFPGQRVLYFDADTRFVRPWDPAAVSGRFAAVLDKSSNERDADCRRYGIDKARYFNSGLWIAGPECSLAFRWAWDLVHKPGYKTGFKYEQTALNAGIQRYAVAVDLLDRRYNAICSPETPPPPDAVVLHCAGGTLHGRNRAIWEKAIRDAETTTP